MRHRTQKVPEGLDPGQHPFGFKAPQSSFNTELGRKHPQGQLTVSGCLALRLLPLLTEGKLGQTTLLEAFFQSADSMSQVDATHRASLGIVLSSCRGRGAACLLVNPRVEVLRSRAQGESRPQRCHAWLLPRALHLHKLGGRAPADSPRTGETGVPVLWRGFPLVTWATALEGKCPHGG